MEELTLEKIEKAVKEKGYVWFRDKNNKGYDVNIVGVRNSKTKNKVTNSFDDKLSISLIFLTFCSEQSRIHIFIMQKQKLQHGIQLHLIVL